MRLLIDTWNVLHHAGDLPGDDDASDIRVLIGLIVSSRRFAKPAELVCDGVWSPALRAVGSTPAAGIRLTMSGAGREADAVIEARIREHTAPRRLTVVSSDRRIRKAARRRRALSLTSDEFLRLLGGEPDRGRAAAGVDVSPSPLSAGEVTAWMDRFGFAADDPLLRVKSSPDASARPKAADATEVASESVAKAPRAPERRLQDDPLLREAMRMWSGRLSWEDLEMDRWLDGSDGADGKTG